MISFASRRSSIVLYIDCTDLNSQRLRMIIEEKNIPADIIEIEPQKLPHALLEINPAGTLPTFADRDLVLSDVAIISEYLEERFPHPPLLPVYPIARARVRLMMLRIEREWYSLAKTITTSSPTSSITEEAQKLLSDSLYSFAPVFSHKPFFMNEDFSVLDCCMAPLLWQLPKLNIVIPSQLESIHRYMEKIFKRASFRKSLGLIDEFESARETT